MYYPTAFLLEEDIVGILPLCLEGWEDNQLLPAESEGFLLEPPKAFGGMGR